MGNFKRAYREWDCVEADFVSRSELGIFLEAVDASSISRLPFSVLAVLINLRPGSDSEPVLMNIEFGRDYPYKPPTITFLSRVPHPLVAEDGSIDLNILGPEWTPAWTLTSLLVSLQSVLAEPAAPDYLFDGCIHNLQWATQEFEVPPQYAPIVFGILRKAIRLPDRGDSRSRGWFSWRYLGALRHLLIRHPWVQSTASLAEWHSFLSSLAHTSAQVCTRHPSTDSQLTQAKRLWIQEAESLLGLLRNLEEPLRVMHLMRSLGRDFGQLQPIQRKQPVWSAIQAFLSCVDDEVLLNGISTRTAGEGSQVSLPAHAVTSPNEEAEGQATQPALADASLSGDARIRASIARSHLTCPSRHGCLGCLIC